MTDSGSQGAFNSSQKDEYFSISAAANITKYRAAQISLDISNNMGEMENPTAGHTGKQISPYSAFVLVLISY